MACSTISSAALGSMTAATIIGGSYALMTTPALVVLRNQPEVQDEILDRFMIITVTAATVGAGLGILAQKAARYAYQRIIGNQW